MIQCQKCKTLIQEGRPHTCATPKVGLPKVSVVNLGDWNSLTPEMKVRIRMQEKLDAVTRAAQSCGKGMVQNLRRLLPKAQVDELEKQVNVAVDAAFEQAHKMLKGS